MASVKLKLKTDKTLKNGSHPIVIQVIHNRKRKVFYIGHSATKSQWDNKSNQPKSKHPDHQIIKSRIKNALIRIKTIINDFENKNQPFELDDIGRKFKFIASTNQFNGYVDELIDSLKAEGKIGNARVYKYSKNAFNSFLKGKPIRLSEIDYRKIKAFESHLKINGNKTNTISLYLRTLRAIINRAIKDGILEESTYAFKNISIKSEKTRKRAVNKDVIILVEKLNVTKENNLQLYKDLFLFSFYNRGMNFIDMAYLKVKNIENGRINYTRRKTGQQFSIKITDKTKAIIYKYNDLKEPDSYIFPIIFRKGKEYLDYKNAIRLMNKKLKKISEILDLDVSLTTYVTRHSWATIAKRSGISTAIISEGLGHESEETTQVYLDSFENDVLDDANELIIN